MANELDKTIEELEAEVLGELDEANGADAPMKSAGAADKMDSIKGEVEDTGAPVTDPEQKDSPAKKIASITVIEVERLFIKKSIVFSEVDKN